MKIHEKKNRKPLRNNELYMYYSAKKEKPNLNNIADSAYIFFFPSVQLLPTEYGKMRAKKKGIEW